MELLFATEFAKFAWQFRDYIQQKYQLTLEIIPLEIPGESQPFYGAFLAKEHPLFAQLQQEAKNFQPFNQQVQNASWEVGHTSTPAISFHLPKIHWRTLCPIKFTFFITCLCALIYLGEVCSFAEPIMQWAHFPAFEAQQREFWRYFSHAFVHLSFWHIGFNLVFWWLFAGAIERQCGSFFLFFLTLSSAFLSGFVQNYFSGFAFFGLSGVVYAVLGFVLLSDKFAQNFALPEGFFMMVIVGILLGFLAPIIHIQMGNAAHISGLLVGLFCASLYLLYQKRRA